MDPAHFDLYQPIETSSPISKKADKAKQKEHDELRKKADLDPRHIRNKERLQAAQEAAEKTAQLRAEARQKQKSEQDDWVPTHRKKTGHIDNPTPKNPAAAGIFNPWSQPRRVVSKPAQPTGPDQSSNPTQLLAPPQEGHMETEEPAQPTQLPVPPQHMEIETEHISTPSPEDQNNCSIQYGPALPPEGEEETDYSYNDDEI